MRLLTSDIVCTVTAIDSRRQVMSGPVGDTAVQLVQSVARPAIKTLDDSSGQRHPCNLRVGSLCIPTSRNVV
jgi:hypothetical protein